MFAIILYQMQKYQITDFYRWNTIAHIRELHMHINLLSQQLEVHIKSHSGNRENNFKWFKWMKLK